MIERIDRFFSFPVVKFRGLIVILLYTSWGISLVHNFSWFGFFLCSIISIGRWLSWWAN